MTNRIAHQKIVSALPATLDADTVYFVRVGAGFDQYVTNSTGTVVAYRANAAGAAGQVQYNNNGLPAGASNVAIEDGHLLLIADQAPPIPNSDYVIHMRQQAQRGELSWVDPHGLLLSAQVALSSHNCWMFSAPASSGAPQLFNIVASVTLGQTLKSCVFNLNSRDHISTKPRVGYRTTTTAGALAYWVSPTRHLFFNSAINSISIAAGFSFVAEFCRDDPSTLVTAARAFIGLTAVATTPTNVEPSTLPRAMGMIKRAADANWQMYSSDASASTPIDLGAEFPANNLDNIYRLAMHSPRNTGRVFWEVYCVNTGAKAVGEFATANLNTNISTFFGPRWWISNHTQAAAADLTVFYGYGDQPR